MTAADVARLGDLVRQAILRLTVLYVRGMREKKELLQRLDAAAVGATDLEQLRRDSDLEQLLSEQGL